MTSSGAIGPANPVTGVFKQIDLDASAIRELIARDRVNLDIIWLKDSSLEDNDSFLPPAVITREIIEDLTTALAEFTAIVETIEQANDWPSNRDAKVLIAGFQCNDCCGYPVE